MIQNITIWPYLISWDKPPSPSIMPYTTIQNTKTCVECSSLQKMRVKDHRTKYYVNPQTTTIHARFRYIDTSLQFRSINCSPLLKNLITYTRSCLTFPQWQHQFAKHFNNSSQIQQFLSMAIELEILLPCQQAFIEKPSSVKKTLPKVEAFNNPTLCNDIITLLYKLTSLHGNNSILAFCQSAKDHFGDKMIPLTTLLDPVFGTGYPVQSKKCQNHTQWLFSHSIPRKESEIFDSIIDNSLRKRNDTVKLTENNMIDLEDNLDSFPAVFALRVTPCSDKGEKKYLLNYTLHAGKLIERVLSSPEFVASHNAKTELEKLQAQFQESYNTGVLFSPFLSLPENLNSGPKNIISIYPNFDSSGRIIFPNDLYFSVNNVEQGIYAYSKKLFLTPYSTSCAQHNTVAQVTFGTFFHDFYQFLNPLPIFSSYVMNKKKVFFPRVEYNNLIIFPKTWIFNTDWIFRSKTTITEAITQLQGLFRLYNVPRDIIFQNSNNDVLIATTDHNDLVHVIQTIRRRLYFVFCEAIGSTNLSHHQKENNHLAEYLLLYKKESD